MTGPAGLLIHLAVAALLLAIGVHSVIDWRRKRRSVPSRGVPIPYPASVDEALATGWTAPGDHIVNPAADLRHNLTRALAVLLIDPRLTIDVGTLAMLSKHKAKAVRGPDGRWRKA